METIKVNNITKKFGTKVLYEDVSFTINKGECIGIVGSNGTGKSVLFKMLAGIEDYDSGQILVNGKRVGKNLDFPENIGYFVNQPGYIEFYDGFTNLKMLADIKNLITDDQIKESMLSVGLNPNDKTKVKNYSQGMKQKLGICQAIMEGQDLIFLDEPFNALDFKSNIDVINIIKKLKEQNKTILMSSHQHEYLEKLTDRMYIILNNKLRLLDENLKKTYFEIF
ncbi:ATP-binding cassette domain-containing protein [Anaerococcus sp. mt242]|uniref:ABC transporter ATP-binding protein n=1 Tax=Anaerococcus sp. mt242 TaxID=2661917 RepID=UPI001933CAD5|nr:ATP-binding cassette domain-containing protein [Anaerococcus sp. mt242]MBM0046199.1 ATP-binding cassette domain-containing protein [Anaerococcus sp. mt242]